MKQTNTFIVLRDKEGNYLASYKNNECVLTYSASWASDVEDALRIPEEWYHGEHREKYLAMAKLFNAEPIKVQAEYTLTTLDGQEPSEPFKDAEDVKDSIKKLLDILTKD
ncbi:TPA: hypothetical protein ACJ51S_001381 [Streptococcus suis]